MMGKCLGWLTILLTWAVVATGQSVYPTLRFTTAQGLPSNTIYDIYRDSKGFLWISTDKGVCRYNGTKFETFTTKNGLSDNEVFFCIEDKSGKIWFATYNGTLCYFEHGLFYNSYNTPMLKLPFRKPFINRIVVEKDSSVCINFAESGIFIDISHGRIKTFNLYSQANAVTLEYLGFPPPYHWRSSLKSILSLNKNSENSYILSSGEAIMEVDSNALIKNMRPILNEKSMSPTFSQGEYYYVSEDGIYSYKTRALLKSFKKSFSDNLLKKPSIITRVYYDGRNYLLTILKKGLYIADSTCIISTNGASGVTQDKFGNYWVGTLDSGLYRVDRNFGSVHLTRNVYPGRISYCCVRNGQILFINSAGEVYHFKNNSASVIHNIANGSPDGVVSVEPGYYIDESSTLYSIAGRHTVTTSLLGPRKYTRVYETLGNLGGIKMVTSMANTIYVHTRKRIFAIEYDKLPGKGLKYHVIEDSVNARVYCMAVSPDSTLWYSSINSMSEIKGSRQVLQGPMKNTPLKTFGFYCGYLVGYTHDNRLIICSRQGHGKPSVVGADQDCIWGKFYQVDSNHVLISTNNYYRLLTLHATNDKPSYEITTLENPSIPTNAEAICANDTSVFFFSGGAVLSADIKILIPQTPPPNLYFDYLKSQTRYYPVNKEIDLTFQESRSITIRFAAVSGTGSDLHYQYSLSGDGTGKWTNISGEEITMVNPAYGSYIVKIRAVTLSSAYSAPISFELIIDKPLWLWWRFIILYVVLVAGAIILLVKWRLQTLLRKREQTHKIEVMFMRSEYKTLNALMNPHFIFNTLNNLQTLFNSEDKVRANKYLRIFANLVRQNMYNVAKDLIPLEKELELVRNYLLLEKLRFNNRLEYTIDIDDDVDLNGIMIPPLLLQPLVENSIKHGILPLKTRNGHIYITVQEADNTIIIEIRDNGVGISNTTKENTEHKSYGLENIQKRIERLNVIQNTSIRCEITEVADDDGHALWTIVKITIPI